MARVFWRFINTENKRINRTWINLFKKLFSQSIKQLTLRICKLPSRDISPSCFIMLRRKSIVEITTKRFTMEMSPWKLPFHVTGSSILQVEGTSLCDKDLNHLRNLRFKILQSTNMLVMAFENVGRFVKKCVKVLLNYFIHSHAYTLDKLAWKVPSWLICIRSLEDSEGRLLTEIFISIKLDTTKP